MEYYNLATVKPKAPYTWVDKGITDVQKWVQVKQINGVFVSALVRLANLLPRLHELPAVPFRRLYNTYTLPHTGRSQDKLWIGRWDCGHGW